MAQSPPGAAAAAARPPATAPPPCAACAAPSKYRCPACDARSCSAACVAAHKAGPPACSGKRPLRSPAFVPLLEFDDAALAQDVAMLQAVQDAAGAAAAARRREGGGRGGGGGDGGGSTRASVRLRRLEAEARRRGITLRLQPPGMDRRARNTTRYDKRARGLAWHVEWRVMAHGAAGPNPSPVLFTADSPAVPEGEALASALGRVLASAGDALAPYAAALEAGSLVLRLAAGGRTSRADPAWLPIDAAATVGAALAGRTVVEFPTIAAFLTAEDAEAAAM